MLCARGAGATLKHAFDFAEGLRDDGAIPIDFRAFVRGHNRAFEASDFGGTPSPWRRNLKMRAIGDQINKSIKQTTQRKTI
jgi:hypothetical protein